MAGERAPSRPCHARLVVNAIRGVAERLVTVSSMDVYRAYGRIHGTEPGPLEPLPLGEEARLREHLYPVPRSCSARAPRRSAHRAPTLTTRRARSCSRRPTSGPPVASTTSTSRMRSAPSSGHARSRLSSGGTATSSSPRMRRCPRISPIRGQTSTTSTWSPTRRAFAGSSVMGRSCRERTDCAARSRGTPRSRRDPAASARLNYAAEDAALLAIERVVP